MATKLGFAVLSDQVGADLPAPNPSLLNGGFGTAEFGFGWHGSGNAAVADGVATLRGGGAGMLNDVLSLSWFASLFLLGHAILTTIVAVATYRTLGRSRAT